MFTGASSTASMFSACSYAQTTLTRANSRVAPLLKIPCTGTTASGLSYDVTKCSNADYMAFREVALEVLRKQAPGIKASQYRHHVVVLPTGNACGWYGMAYVGCESSCAAWIQGDALLSYKPGSRANVHPLMHELGHNLVRTCSVSQQYCVVATVHACVGML